MLIWKCIQHIKSDNAIHFSTKGNWKLEKFFIYWKKLSVKLTEKIFVFQENNKILLINTINTVSKYYKCY